MSDLYYILSKKHESGDLCSWWGPDSKGYRASLVDAGHYTLEQALRAIGGVDRLDENVPVPCEEADAVAGFYVRRDRHQERAWIDAARLFGKEGRG